MRRHRTGRDSFFGILRQFFWHPSVFPNSCILLYIYIFSALQKLLRRSKVVAAPANAGQQLGMGAPPVHAWNSRDCGCHRAGTGLVLTTRFFPNQHQAPQFNKPPAPRQDAHCGPKARWFKPTLCRDPERSRHQKCPALECWGQNVVRQRGARH